MSADDPNANRPGYKETKVGWIPEEWRVEAFANGFKRIVRPPVELVADSKYKEIGVRSHGKGIFYKHERAGAEIGEKRVFWVEPKRLIFNIVFAWEQAVAVTRDADDGYIASHRFPMYKPDKDGWTPEFGCWYLRTERGKHALGIASPGGAGRNRTLSQAELEFLFMPKPSASEQEKIAKVLSTCDEAIESAGQLIDAKKRQKRALTQQLLTGKKRLPGFAKSGEKTATRTGAIPADWKSVPLSHVFEKRVERSGDELPLMAVTIESGLVSRDSVERKVDSELSASDNLVARRGDIAYNTMRMWQGAVGVAEQDCHVSPAYVVCSPREGLADSKFFYYWFKSAEGLHLLWSYSYGITGDRLRLYADDFAKVPAPLPSLEEQRAIVSVIEAAEEEIASLRQKQSALVRQRKALMQKLLTGQVRVTV